LSGDNEERNRVVSLENQAFNSPYAHTMEKKGTLKFISCLRKAIDDKSVSSFVTY